jgi:hypothetical protein
LILRMDSSFPKISASSIAPPGEVCSPSRSWNRNLIWQG